ncbi:HEPN domain-containing protein [Clostridium sp. 001]|uniref:HEPN domain-containing protein n=1 Tax=Clostridium sp. 001 TaxID=1970093 RepID=UPI001C2C5C99|nr:HEPN domain-containing protein [Clostridium sp. 001]QXE18843.1 hypothetical protein B5S50_08375 [Clostridium sp. 001]
MPKVFICNVGNEKIEFTYKLNAKSDFLSNFTMYQYEFVSFKFFEKVYYKNALDRIWDFAKLLTLCIGKRVSPLSITSKNESGQKVEFIYPASNIMDKEVIKEHDICIKFSYIRDIFENVINNWKVKKDKLEPIIDYFVDAYEKVFMVPTSFLKVIQAIEAYSRRMRKNAVLPQAEFEKKVQNILEKVESSEDRELIKSILSNEPRLRKRLAELFNETNYVFDISSKKRKLLICEIVDTRNYYTHFDNKSKYKILEPERMFYASSFMKLVLRVLLMQELGMSKELIKSRMKEDQELIYIKQGLQLIEPISQFNMTFIPDDKKQSNPLNEKNKSKC